MTPSIATLLWVSSVYATRPTNDRELPRSGANTSGLRRTVTASPAYPPTSDHSPV
jgi:hypothetical protein